TSRSARWRPQVADEEVNRTLERKVGRRCAVGVLRGLREPVPGPRVVRDLGRSPCRLEPLLELGDALIGLLRIGLSEIAEDGDAGTAEDPARVRAVVDDRRGETVAQRRS